MELVEEIADFWKTGTAIFQEILDMQPEELNEGELTDINGKNGCEGKDEKEKSSHIFNI